MSLNYTGSSTDKCRIAAAASIDDLPAMTYAFWVKIPSTNFGYIGGKRGTNGYWKISTNSTGVLEFERIYSGTNARADSNNNMFTLDTWVFCAFTDGGVGVIPDLYVGDLATIVSNVSGGVGYSTQQAGTGTLTIDNTNDMCIMNRTISGGNDAQDGDIAWAGLFNRVLTLNELRLIQFNPVRGAAALGNNCVLNMPFGVSGLSTQIDYSGDGNHGVLTGGQYSTSWLPLGSLWGFDDYTIVPASAAAAVNFLYFSENIMGGRGLKTRNNDLELALGNIAKQTVFERFGRNSDVDGAEDVWNGGGTYTGFPPEIETLEIASSDAADTAAGTGARTVKIMNLLDSTGAVSPDVTVTLNGTTQVSLGALTYTRASSMRVLTSGSGGANAGTLTLRHTSQTSNIFAVMPIGLNKTAISAFTVPLGYTLYINERDIRVSRSGNATVSADTSLRFRESGGVFETAVAPSITNHAPYSCVKGTYYKFIAQTDIKWSVDAISASNGIVTSEFNGILIAD